MHQSSTDKYLTRKMTRVEYNLLSPDEKKERKRIQQKNSYRKYYQQNAKKILTDHKNYKEKMKRNAAISCSGKIDVCVL